MPLQSKNALKSVSFTDCWTWTRWTVSCPCICGHCNDSDWPRYVLKYRFPHLRTGFSMDLNFQDVMTSKRKKN